MLFSPTKSVKLVPPLSTLLEPFQLEKGKIDKKIFNLKKDGVKEKERKAGTFNKELSTLSFPFLASVGSAVFTFKFQVFTSFHLGFTEPDRVPSTILISAIRSD